MGNYEFVPKIPYGTRDFLPKEARRKREVEGALARLFAAWGYDEIVTPSMEYLETLEVSTNDQEHHMFKFFDKNNRILAMRPDMTTPMARAAATRLQDSPLPIKLFYLTNVFRDEEAQTGRQCEFYQAGVELMGVSAPTADAEVIALAIGSMLTAGLEKFQIALGQVDFINGVMASSGLPAKQQQQVKTALLKRNLVGIEEILKNSTLSAGQRQLLQQIPLLHGKEELLEKAYTLADNPVSRAALDNLAEIYRLLEGYGLAQYVDFDLGIIRDFNYYTGMVFEGYTPGLGFPVCGGGRYDTMLSSFGMDMGATGFALGIERLLLAQERQGRVSLHNHKDIYIGWSEQGMMAAIAKAQSLRQQGQSAELGLMAQSRAEAEESCRMKGYNQLIYI